MEKFNDAPKYSKDAAADEAKVLKEMMGNKDADSYAEAERTLIHEELEKDELFGIVMGNYATVEGWSNVDLSGHGIIEHGIQTMEKHGYELSGPVSVTYVPQEGLPSKMDGGAKDSRRGAIFEKATFRKKNG